MSLTDEDKKWFSEQVEAMVARFTEEIAKATREMQTEIVREGKENAE